MSGVPRKRNLALNVPLPKFPHIPRTPLQRKCVPFRVNTVLSTFITDTGINGVVRAALHSLMLALKWILSRFAPRRTATTTPSASFFFYSANASVTSLNTVEGRSASIVTCTSREAHSKGLRAVPDVVASSPSASLRLTFTAVQQSLQFVNQPGQFTPPCQFTYWQVSFLHPMDHPHEKTQNQLPAPHWMALVYGTQSM